MERLFLKPVGRVCGAVALPGSKSISNRALLLASLAEGTTVLKNLLRCDDTGYMLRALKDLGVSYQLSFDKSRCEVVGLAGGGFPSMNQELYLGNAGTAMRPLLAALSLDGRAYTLHCDPRMKERPISHLVVPLRECGASIAYLETDGYPPLQVQGGAMQGKELFMDGTLSSQFLTSLLLIAPYFQGDTLIRIKGDLVSKPYIHMTMAMMKQFGVEVSSKEDTLFKVQGGQIYRAPGEFLVEGDASSASYFLAIGAISQGEMKVSGITKESLQGDIQFVDVLAKMGALVEWGDDFVTVRGGRPLQGVDLDLNHIPDAAMTVAVVALFARGQTLIRNIFNWRLKESDRLSAMATELRKVGADVEEGDDYIKITPPKLFKHAEIDTYHDHRMAMCFSLVAFSDAGVTIKDPSCTSKTFPNYFDEFRAITQAK